MLRLIDGTTGLTKTIYKAKPTPALSEPAVFYHATKTVVTELRERCELLEDRLEEVEAKYSKLLKLLSEKRF